MLLVLLCAWILINSSRLIRDLQCTMNTVFYNREASTVKHTWEESFWMAVVILNFVLLLVYPRLSEIQLHALTSPCKTIQTVVKPVKYNVIYVTAWPCYFIGWLVRTCIYDKFTSVNFNKCQKTMHLLKGECL